MDQQTPRGFPDVHTTIRPVPTIIVGHHPPTTFSANQEVSVVTRSPPPLSVSAIRADIERAMRPVVGADMYGPA